MGKKYGIPVFAVVGGIEGDVDALYENGITSIFSIVEKPMELRESIENASYFLYRAIQRFMRLVLVFQNSSMRG